MLTMEQKLHVSQSTSGGNWRNHLRGLSLLVRTRGPTKHMTGMAHALFCDWRHNFVRATARFKTSANFILILNQMIVAVLERTQSYLSSRDWMIIPFAIEPKGIRDELMDILLEIPTLLEQADAAKLLSAQGSLAERDRLEENLQIWEQAMTEWHKRLVSRYPQSQNLEERLSSRPCDSSAKLAPQETLIGHTIVLYWTGCLMLNGISQMSFQMLGVLDREVSGREVSGTCSSTYNADFCATAIAHSLGRFLEPRLGTHIALMTFFPLSVCLLYFKASGNMGHPALLQLNTLFAELSAAGLPLQSFLQNSTPKVDRSPILGFMDFRL